MAAINQPLIARDMVTLATRNWPAQNKGVMVVFCIVGAVAILLIGLWLYKLQQRRKNKA